MKVTLIGNGAISQFVQSELVKRGHEICAILVRTGSVRNLTLDHETSPVFISRAEDIPNEIDHVIDCAGHSGLREHGAKILRGKRNLITLSLGALAEDDLRQSLECAARSGGSKLYLASGAIGGLDCLRAAKVGNLSCVRYTGRKPPLGWQGSSAERKLDLESITITPKTHFLGSARDAATEYPKNANVAAAVALAGLGFDDTKVELIADPNITQNIHEIAAKGDFGDMHLRISGEALPNNPRSSALAAMSVVSILERLDGPLLSL